MAPEVRISAQSPWFRLSYFVKISTALVLPILGALMIAGTLAEGRGGADFAARLIYARWYFSAPLYLLFFTIIISFFCALPLKRKLLGTYLMQAGMILLGLEYTMISWNGLSGSMTLPPNTLIREMDLAEDLLTISYEAKGPESTGESVQLPLPHRAFSTKLHDSYREILLTTFLPFSEKVLSWTYPSGPRPGTYPSSRYQIVKTATEPHTELDVVFSLHPEAKEFSSLLELDPLSVHYLPEEVAPCFERIGESKIILWDIQSKVCFTPEEQKIPIQRPVVGKRFLAIKRDHEFHSFFPDFSPYPLTQDLNPIKTSPLRIMALNNFEAGQHLFLMGPSLAFMREGKWVKESLSMDNQHHIQHLMLDITLLHHTVEKIPAYLPQFVYPTQSQGRLLTGKTRAVQFLVQGHSHWVTNEMPIQLELNKQLVTFTLKKKSIAIPLSVSLSQVSPEGSSLYITMPGHSGHYLISENHPLRFDGVTFYQQTQHDGTKENKTILSVDLKPRSYLKYIGVMMAFLGLILYFIFQNTGKREGAT